MTIVSTNIEDIATDGTPDFCLSSSVSLQLTDAEQAELERIHTLIETAHSLPEVEAAQQALRAWVARYPGEKERLADVFEQLFLMQESAREAQAEAAAMGLTAEEGQRREYVFALRRQVHSEDLFEIFEPTLAAARQALQEWQLAHPEDPQLAYLHEALDMEESMAHTFRQTRQVLSDNDL